MQLCGCQMEHPAGGASPCTGCSSALCCVRLPCPIRECTPCVNARRACMQACGMATDAADGAGDGDASVSDAVLHACTAPACQPVCQPAACEGVRKPPCKPPCMHAVCVSSSRKEAGRTLPSLPRRGSSATSDTGPPPPRPGLALNCAVCLVQTCAG